MYNLLEKFAKYEEKTFVGFNTEPEIKYSDTGSVSCKFSILLKENNDSKETLWLNCKAYKETAEAFAELCPKGCLVKVSGRFYQYEYNSNIYTEFFVREFLKLADPKPKDREE